MNAGLICNYGDAFSIAYVKPSASGVNVVNVYHSYGGILLFRHIITNFPIFDGRLPELRREVGDADQRVVDPSEPAHIHTGEKEVANSFGGPTTPSVAERYELVTIASNTVPTDQRKDTARRDESDGPSAGGTLAPEAPLRISYYLRQDTSDQEDAEDPKGPWLMADAANRAGMLHVKYAPERPPMPVYEDLPSVEWNVFFERITESGHRQECPLPKPLVCRDWVRAITPINDASRGIPDEYLAKSVVDKVTGGACVIVSARQLAATMRVRLQSSYEAMTVDLIRYWDWTDRSRKGQKNFASLFGRKTLDELVEKGREAMPLYVVCRLPGGALLIYGGDWPSKPAEREPGGDRGKSTNGIDENAPVNQEKSGDPVCRAYLVFDRRRPADIRQVGGGVAKGTGMVVAACIVKALARRKERDFHERLCDGAKMALQVTTAYLKTGVACVIHNYGGCGHDDKDPRINSRAFIAAREQIYLELEEAMAADLKKGNPFQSLELKIEIVRSREKRWSVVRHALEKLIRVDGLDGLYAKNQQERKTKEEGRDPHANEKILYREAGRLLLSPGSKITEEFPSVEPRELFKSIPMVKFGNLELIDREEIEDYLAMQSILLNYLESNPSKPLNLGVFGPPGSGKSFGTKELLKHVGKGGNTFQPSPNEFNLSQFRGLDGLAQALHIVRDEGLRGTMPVAFFDEFDTSFQGNAYGMVAVPSRPNARRQILGQRPGIFAGAMRAGLRGRSQPAVRRNERTAARSRILCSEGAGFHQPLARSAQYQGRQPPGRAFRSGPLSPAPRRLVAKHGYRLAQGRKSSGSSPLDGSRRRRGPPGY
jgi:hypothetical protein